MPALGSYNEDDYTPATRSDINRARIAAESVVNTRHGAVQFDPASRQRISDTIYSMDKSSTVNWGMADNSVVVFTYTGLQEMYEDALANASENNSRAYEVSKLLKERMDAGSTVTLSDVNNAAWK